MSRESVIVTNIKKALNDLPQTYFFKIWGSAFQAVGISDLIGVSHGRFVALEVKKPEKKFSGLTKIQRWFLVKVRDCGGVAAVVTSVDEALEVIDGEIRVRVQGMQRELHSGATDNAQRNG